MNSESKSDIMKKSTAANRAKDLVEKVVAFVKSHDGWASSDDLKANGYDLNDLLPPTVQREMVRQGMRWGYQSEPIRTYYVTTRLG